MRGYLRGIGLVLLIGGLGTCVLAAAWAIGDSAFFDAKEALARHPDHVLFQGEYYAALVRHLSYILTAVLAGLLGVVGSAMLLGLHEVLRRLDQLEAARASSPPR